MPRVECFKRVVCKVFQTFGILFLLISWIRVIWFRFREFMWFHTDFKCRIACFPNFFNIHKPEVFQQIYRIGVAFNRQGKYRLAECGTQTICEGVTFTFGSGRYAGSIRDGLIRTIIFTYWHQDPQWMTESRKRGEKKRLLEVRLPKEMSQQTLRGTIYFIFNWFIFVWYCSYFADLSHLWITVVNNW